MALKVVWSARAKAERKAILRFFLERNGNPNYSRELAKHLDTGMRLVAGQELLGRTTEVPKVRCLFVLNYSLFYSLIENSVVVASLWDNRQDPEKRPF